MRMTKNRRKKIISYNALFFGIIDCNKRKKNIKSDSFVEKLSINDADINFQLDTGAKCNVLSNSDFKGLNINRPLQKSDTALRSYSGHRTEPEGMITIPLTCKDSRHNVQFYIVETKSHSVLNGETCEETDLLKRINSIEKGYPEIFEGLGCLPSTYHIKLDTNATPVVQSPRRVPIPLKNKVNVRICIDPKDLNNVIQREHYPMKTVEEIVAEMPNAKIFSTLDAISGFWTLKLDEERSELTTFQTPFGRYRFLCAPFGIKSIPEYISASWQKWYRT